MAKDRKGKKSSVKVEDMAPHKNPKGGLKMEDALVSSSPLQNKFAPTIKGTNLKLNTTAGLKVGK